MQITAEARLRTSAGAEAAPILGVGDEVPSPGSEQVNPGPAGAAPVTDPRDPSAHQGPNGGVDGATAEAADCFRRLDSQRISLEVSHDLLIKGRAAYDRMVKEMDLSQPYVVDDFAAQNEAAGQEALNSQARTPDGQTRQPPENLTDAAHAAGQIGAYFQDKLSADAVRARETAALGVLAQSKMVRLEALRRGMESLDDTLGAIKQEFDLFSDTIAEDVLAAEMAAAQAEAVRAAVNSAISQERFDEAEALLDRPTVAEHLQDSDIAAYKEFAKHEADTAKEQKALIESLRAANQKQEFEANIAVARAAVESGVDPSTFAHVKDALFTADPEGAEARWAPVRDAEVVRQYRIELRQKTPDELAEMVRELKRELDPATDQTGPIDAAAAKARAQRLWAATLNLEQWRLDLFGYQNLDPEMRAASDRLKATLISGEPITDQQAAEFEQHYRQAAAFQHAQGAAHVKLLDKATVFAVGDQLMDQVRAAPVSDHIEIYRQFAGRFGPLAEPLIAQLVPEIGQRHALQLRLAADGSTDVMAEILKLENSDASSPESELHPDIVLQIDGRLRTLGKYHRQSLSADPANFKRYQYERKIMRLMIMRDVQDSTAPYTEAVVDEFVQSAIQKVHGSDHAYLDTGIGVLRVPDGRDPDFLRIGLETHIRNLSTRGLILADGSQPDDGREILEALAEGGYHIGTAADGSGLVIYNRLNGDPLFFKDGSTLLANWETLEKEARRTVYDLRAFQRKWSVHNRPLIAWEQEASAFAKKAMADGLTDEALWVEFGAEEPDRFGNFSRLLEPIITLTRQ